MDFFRDFFNSITPPQITWAMIFAVLGFLTKTAIDYYIQRRQTVNELLAESKLEKSKEQETIIVATLSQILQATHDISWIFYQLLGHAQFGAQAYMRDPDHIKAHDYTIASTALGLGSLLAQLRNFRTYQFFHIQKQLNGVSLIKRIDNIEGVLSRYGVFRNYQADLGLYALKSSHADIERIIQSRRSRAKEPTFLQETIAWADKLVNDFVKAWLDVAKHTPRQDSPTLAERGIDISQFIPEDSTIQSNHPELGDVVSLVRSLRVNDQTAEFIEALYELHAELNAVFTKLEKHMDKHGLLN